jgi:SynChlorMet cassette radical SAM/SPASM protein ScmE
MDEPMRLMRTPRSLDLEITARCNARCRYCYFFDNPEVNYQDLPTDTWLTFINELGQNAVMEVTLQGGEPFMQKDLKQFIDAIVRNRMRFTILSNGALITDDMAAYIAETGRCNNVQVSLDGSNADTHDAYRGQGSFEGAVRGIHTLQRHGVPVTTRMTIHHMNVHDIENTVHFNLEVLGLNSFGTNAVGYLGTCKIGDNEMQLSPVERKTAMKVLVKLADQYPGQIGAMAGPLAEARMWQRMEEAREQQAEPFPNGGHLTGCGCTTNKLAVRSDGAIIPCTMLPSLVLGHINQDALIDVWQNAPILDKLRNRTNIALSEFAFCADCPYQPYCTGNCPGLAYSLTGKVNHPSPDACYRNFKQALESMYERTTAD